MALTISTSISVKPDRRAAHGLGASKGSDGAASIAVVDNNGPMTLRLRQAKRHALARTRATRRGGAQERAPAAQPRDSGFRGCRGLAGRNGTFQSMMPLIVASRGSDWKEDGAGRLSPFLLYGGVFPPATPLPDAYFTGRKLCVTALRQFCRLLFFVAMCRDSSR